MGFLKKALDPGGHFQGTVNLRTLYDPGDLLGGQAASDKLKAAQNLQQLASMQAVREQERQYREGIAQMDPYRQYGMRALAPLQESLQPGSQLGTMRSNLGQQYMPQALAGTGFNPAVIDELMGRYQASIGAQEETSRMNRAGDMMRLGMGGAQTGAGLAGQQGGSLADIYLQGAQMQGQQAVNQSLARRQQGMGAMYGGYRGLMNYLGGAYG